MNATALEVLLFVAELRQAAVEERQNAVREENATEELVALSTSTTCDLILREFDWASRHAAHAPLATELVQ